MKKKNFPIWTILYRNLIFILIVTIVFCALAFLYSKKKKSPTYTASKQVIVSCDIDVSTAKSRANNSLTLADLILPTIISSFTSDEANKVINNYLKEKYGEEAFIYSGSIGTSIDETLIFTISYSDSINELAEKRLDYAIEGFSAWLDEFDKTGRDITSTGSISISPVQRKAEVKKTTPYFTDAILGAGIGLIISIVAVILIYIFDNKVRSEEELKELTGLNIIAHLGNKL